MLPPSEPINTTTYGCDVVILGIRRTILKISPYYKKRNKQFRASKKKKVKNNLEKYLLSDKEIKNFVSDLSKNEIWFEGTHLTWPNWKYYSCRKIIDLRNGLKYFLLFFLDDNNPEFIGIINAYPC